MASVAQCVLDMDKISQSIVVGGLTAALALAGYAFFRHHPSAPVAVASPPTPAIAHDAATPVDAVVVPVVVVHTPPLPVVHPVMTLPPKAPPPLPRIVRVVTVARTDEATRLAAEERARREHAATAAAQQSTVRRVSREHPEDPQVQALVATAMHNAVASHDRARITSLRQEISWLAGMPAAFRNRDAIAQTATALPEWVAAHDDDDRPNERWIQWATQNLR